MPSREIMCIVDAIINSIEGELTDELIRKLQTVVPETIVSGALDLLDRQNVIKYTTPCTYPQYQILGSSDIYAVFLDMTVATIPFYCSCPAFAFAVLSGSHIMCKHVLAARLSNKLSLFLERPMTPEDLQTSFLHQFRLDDDS